MGFSQGVQGRQHGPRMLGNRLLVKRSALAAPRKSRWVALATAQPVAAWRRLQLLRGGTRALLGLQGRNPGPPLANPPLWGPPEHDGSIASLVRPPWCVDIYRCSPPAQPPRRPQGGRHQARRL